VFIGFSNGVIYHILRMTSNAPVMIEGTYDSTYKNSLFTIRDQQQGLSAYRLQAQTKFSTESGKVLTRSNILEGDRVRLTISGQDIQEIVLLKRELITKQSVVTWDASSGVLAVTDTQNRLNVYRISAETQQLTANGASVLKMEQWSNVLKRGTVLDLTVRDQLIMTVQVNK
jgi:hypothetical protein